MRSRLRVVLLGVVSLALVCSVAADPAAAAKRKVKPRPRPARLAVRLSGPSAAAVGQSVSLGVSTVVPRGDRVTSFVLLWGDGSKPVTGKRVPGAVSHTYSRAGSFTVSVIVASKHKVTARASRVVQVSAPTVTPAPAPAPSSSPSPPPSTSPSPVNTPPSTTPSASPSPSSSVSPSTSPSPSSGTLSLLAGRTQAVTPGPATMLPVFAEATAVDGSGNLFIADSANRVVEKVTPAGDLSILAGIVGQSGAPVPGPATWSPLAKPVGVAVDSAGNVLIADDPNNRVEKVTPGGVLSVIAGNGNYGSPVPGPATASPLRSPAGIAVDGGGDVFIADSFNHRVEKVSPGGTLSVIAGTGAVGPPVQGPATSSPLNLPTGVAVGTAGDVFIADAGNDVVERVDSGGTLSVIAGNGAQGAPVAGPATSSPVAPSGVAVNRLGDVFVADTYNSVVEKVTGGTLSIVAGNGTSGGPVPGPATASPLASPSGVALDSAGDFFVADHGNSSVEKVTPGGTLSVVAGRVSFGPPTPGPATSSLLDNPCGVAVGAGGDVFIADTYNSVVEKITTGGALSIIAGNGTPGAPVSGPATSSPLSAPVGVATDSAGDVFIADAGNYEVEKVSPNGTLSVIAGNGSSGVPVSGPAASSPLGYPVGVAIDHAGNVFVADFSKNRIERVTPTGMLSIAAGTGTAGPVAPGPATSSSLDRPAGVAVNASGEIFIADSGHNLIEKVDTTGNLSIVAGNGTQASPTAGPATSTALNAPSAVALDSAGNVFIADRGNALVEKVTPSGALSVVAGNGTSGPPRPGPASSSPLFTPRGVTVDLSGALIIADPRNHDIERVTGL